MMNRLAAMFAIALLAGCSGEPDAGVSAPVVAADPATSTTASATGTVEAIDLAAGKITIAHGPVESLEWPAMTMRFKATPAQVAAVQVGQEVRFEFASTGMDGTILSIEPVE